MIPPGTEIGYDVEQDREQYYRLRKRHRGGAATGAQNQLGHDRRLDGIIARSELARGQVQTLARTSSLHRLTLHDLSRPEPFIALAMERYICIHGHFYQPPRENPWLEAIELQDSAYPYHDWNERITAECYAPNSVSRILDGESRIVQLVNNYSKISFNFGPTLLSWLEAKAPDVYRRFSRRTARVRKNSPAMAPPWRRFTTT